MESIKKSVEDLTMHFNSKMDEFQKELKSAIPATSPSSNINSQFSAFRTFVLLALENLQLQVQLLTRQYDDLEMRSRRKILLVHGVAEDKKEDTSACVVKVLSERLGGSYITPEVISRSHRLGKSVSDKPRAILVKFKDLTVKDKVWLDKKCLKGSGITLSEFLTKDRHAAFLLARERFGVSRCWTWNGVIQVLGPGRTRYHVRSKSDLAAIPSSEVAAQSSPAAAALVQSVTKEARKDTPQVKDRPKRNANKK